MKFFAILLIMTGLGGIAVNILFIPSLHFPEGANQRFMIAYCIGAFALALAGLLLVVIGGILYRRAARRQRISEARFFSIDFEQKGNKAS
jgi:CBS domain containing-hemolysin-like protein